MEPTVPLADAAPYWQVPRLRPGVLAGVAGGIAEEIGVDPLWIRLGFIALFAAKGWGAAIYVVMWAGLAWYGYQHDQPVAPRVAKGKSVAHRQFAAGLIVLGFFGLFVSLPGLPLPVVWPLGLGGGGVVVLWRRISAGLTRRHQRDGGPSTMLPTTGIDWAQVIGSVVVIVVAFIALVWPMARWGTGAQLMVAALLCGLGVAALSAPWWWRLISDLDAERQARARSDERAEVAAHIHDSVLQTLALIQRNADDPQMMLNLARRQERELRNWLDPDRMSRQGRSLRGQLDAMASEVEELHGTVVEMVIVGDVLLDPAIEAIVGATREAVVNAAKHSGTEQIDVYAEVQPDQIEIFVRDAGGGFDPAAIGSDRRGVRFSIEDRMSRAGGRAVILSSLGEGTEVELLLPRSVTPEPAVSDRGTADPSGDVLRAEHEGEGVDEARGEGADEDGEGTGEDGEGTGEDRDPAKHGSEHGAK